MPLFHHQPHNIPIPFILKTNQLPDNLACIEDDAFYVWVQFQSLHFKVIVVLLSDIFRKILLFKLVLNTCNR